MRSLAEHHIDGLAQDCSNPNANALELLQPCTKSSICAKNKKAFVKQSDQIPILEMILKSPIPGHCKDIRCTYI